MRMSGLVLTGATFEAGSFPDEGEWEVLEATAVHDSLAFELTWATTSTGQTFEIAPHWEAYSESERETRGDTLWSAANALWMTLVEPTASGPSDSGAARLRELESTARKLAGR